MTTPIDLDALEALLAKATPGTWALEERRDYTDIVDGTGTSLLPTGWGGEPLIDRDDAALIVAAVNALPALIRELREARASVEIAADAYRKTSLELSAVAAQLRSKP